MKKRLISLLIAVCLLVSLLPAVFLGASADGATKGYLVLPGFNNPEVIDQTGVDAPVAHYYLVGSDGKVPVDPNSAEGKPLYADESTYNAKFAFDANGIPTLYLKGAAISGGNAITFAKLNATDDIGKYNLVVESDSQLTASLTGVLFMQSTKGNELSIYGPGKLTINASASAKGIDTRYHKLTIKPGADILINANTGDAYYTSGDTTNPGEIIMEGGKLTIETKAAPRMQGVSSFLIEGGEVEINAKGAVGAMRCASTSGGILFKGGKVTLTSESGDVFHNATSAAKIKFVNGMAYDGASEATKTAITATAPTEETAVRSGMKYFYYEATQPSNPETQPSTPVTEPSTPVTEPSTPVTEPSTPVTEPSTPATEPSTPATEPSTPATEPSTPATEPSTPVTEPSTPVTEPSTPVTEPSTPVTEPSTPATEPEATQPDSNLKGFVVLSGFTDFAMVNAQDPVKYYKTDAAGLITAADANDYTIKFAFENDVATLYLKGAYIKGATAIRFGKEMEELDCQKYKLVVETDSVLETTKAGVVLTDLSRLPGYRASLTLAGPGKLTINNNNPASTIGAYDAGIATCGPVTVAEGTNIVINAADAPGWRIGGNAQVTINGGNMEIAASGGQSHDHGIQLAGTGELIVNGGKLKVTATTSGGYPLLIGNGSAALNGGIVELSDATKVTNKIAKLSFTENKAVAGDSKETAAPVAGTALSAAVKYFYYDNTAVQTPSESQPGETQPEATQPEATTPDATQPTTPADPVPPSGDVFDPMVVVLILASVAALAVLTINRKKFI